MFQLVNQPIISTLTHLSYSSEGAIFISITFAAYFYFPVPYSTDSLVTFRLSASRAWVAAMPLNTHCKATEHNETARTQALSDDMQSMHKPNLHPLSPYKMHLLYVIMLFEAHRQRDISSTSVFGQFIPSVHLICYQVLTPKKKRTLAFLTTGPKDPCYRFCIRFWLRLKQGKGYLSMI